MAKGINEFSPMMQKYLQTKEDYKDCLLLYRLGDFYEMFFDDAKIASKALDIALTGRNCGLEERAPMCGVPYHAVDTYIAKLLEKGHKVAICDQMGDPVKGQIVERAVTRVITPGTIIESEILEDKTNNYILCLFKNLNNVGISYCDVSTGEFKVSEITSSIDQGLISLLTRLRPAEIICNEEMQQYSVISKELKMLDFLPRFNKVAEYSFDDGACKDLIRKQFNISSFQGHDFSKLNYAIKSCGALLDYLISTQKRSLNHINKIVTERQDDFLYMDYNACRNLELVENIKDRKKKGSLLGHLNKTKTAMGLRLLERWILQPLQDAKKINNRLDCVEELFYNNILLSDITSTLSNINDIARTCSKISYGTIMPKDCVSLKNSLLSVIDLSNLIKELKNQNFSALFKEIQTIKDISSMLQEAFVENPPAIVSNGGFINQNFNEELFELKNASTKAKDWLSEYEAKEREQTGIKNLKVGYSRIIGYYIEINKSQENLVPYRYIRKQTISNHERFITDELKEIEEKLLNASEMAIKLENVIFSKIKEHLKSVVNIIQQIAADVAFVDVIGSLASVSVLYNYTRPNISSNLRSIKIQNGRHPIVEANLKSDTFVANDAFLNDKDDRTIIITGPNMAGKSTFMRQIALIVIMAHIGCFVPATSADICIVDRIFTRIGASDDLSNGQSTFMVEMTEVANILNNATNKSLVLLDEVGRGTATYDGMSIAWAVLEYISSVVKCKTLFSTHYHEITTLEGSLEGVKNYKIGVKEFNNSIIFLRKVVKGSADKSFGIEVASLSGIYDQIIIRAKAILNTLEKNSVKLELDKIEKNQSNSIINKDNIINKIKNIDINKISPMEAFEILIDLTKDINK